MKITNVNDYVDIVQKKFPELTKEEIKKILVYGWKMIVQYVSAGNDIQIKDKNLFFFIGEIPINSLNMYKRYYKKLALRVSYMYQRLKQRWDGYYYFTRTEKQYKDYLSQSRKKYKIFKNVKLYKILEEAKLTRPSDTYIFRVKEDKTDWRKKFYTELKTENAELIEIRDVLRMENLMTSCNKFKYIK